MALPAKPQGAYGVDAPLVPLVWAGFCLLFLVLAVLALVAFGWPWWAGFVLAVIAVGFAGGAALYWHATFRGKFLVWARALDALPVAECLRVLDLGCGRGAVAIQ